MGKPKFDPNKPFTVADAGAPAEKPKFDPNAPFEAAPEPEAEKPGMLDRFKYLFSPEGKKEAADIQAANANEIERQKMAGTSLMQTELEQTANALTLGYLPQLQAGAASLAGEDYVSSRDANIKRLQRQREEHPSAALAGDVAGTLGNAYLLPLPTVGKGAGIIGGAIKGAQVGGAYGALQNPGDVEGVVNPLQVDERVENAKQGAKLGATIGGAAGAGQAIAKKVGEIGGKMKGAGEAAAFKSSGAMLKDFRQAAGKDEVNKIGRFMLDEGMVKAGDTFETVAQKASKINQDAGQKLDQIYSKATKAAGQAADGMPGFNPYRDKAQILEVIKKDLGDAPGAGKIVQRVDDYIENLAEKYGDNVLSPRMANDLKGLVDKEINYARNPLNAKPKTEKAYSTLRRYLEDKVHSQVEYLGQRAGQKGLGAELRATNQRYGLSKRIQNIAEDRMARVQANNAFGLSDRIAGGAGAAVGGVAAAAQGDGDPIEILMKGAGAGLLAAGANNMIGKYGNSTLARGLDRSGGLLQSAGQAGQALTPSPALAARLAVERNRKGKKGLIDERKGIIPISGETP